MSCSGPMLACGREVQPPIRRTGTRASEALAMEVTVLVTPGPAVTMATPNPPVSSAWAWAIWTAARSSRTSMMRMPSWAVVPDRLDVTTLQAEDAVDATGLQGLGNPGGNTERIVVQVQAGDVLALTVMVVVLLVLKRCSAELLTQQPVKDLAGRVARHLFRHDEDDRARALVAGQLVAAPLGQCRLIQRWSVAAHDGSGDARSPHFSSARPMQATSATAGWEPMTASTSDG